MHAVVFIKQVPQQNSVKITPDKQIDASGIEPIISLFDEYALEEALLQVEKNGGQVTVVTIGGEEQIDALRKALAMGANQAILVNDPVLAKIGALGAAKVGAAVVKKLGDFDAIFCGKQSTDDETAVFGPALARYLGLPVLSYVFKVHELDANARRVVVDRAMETTTETVEASLPAVLTTVKDLNQPRYPSLLKIKKAQKADIPRWTAADLGLNPTELAPKVTYLDRVPPPPRPKGSIIDGASAQEKARKLVDALVDTQVI
ncbi:MAG: electron transfer flavoprotein subunit beta [Chloroflexi bacterium]|nr:MAG: electron transfer flavoprotein subunit beta [Chloroflexota bacterium]